MIFRMTLIVTIVAILTSVLIISSMRTKKILLEEFKEMCMMHLFYFEVFGSLLDKDLGLPEIVADISEENLTEKSYYNELCKNTKGGYIQFDVGNRYYVEVKNTKELRKAFIFSGDFLINLEENLLIQYGVCFDDEAEEIYNNVLDSVRQIRQICLSKNESATSKPEKIRKKT